MGSLSQTPPDLKLTILSTETLRPRQPTERRSMFLSNIDQVLTFTVETVHFFGPAAGHPFGAVVGRLRAAVEGLLVPYDFLAGRLRSDGGEGRMEVDCNAEGVEFVVASSGLRLDELGELEYPNPAFRQLAAVAGASGDAVESDGRPLCAFQVTSFKCGGFALGISTDHAAFDGISFQLFLKNLASLAHNHPLAAPPFNDRRLLAARSPPFVEFPHPELVKLELPTPREEEEVPTLNPPPTILDAASDALELKLFRLDSNNIDALKEKAKGDGTVDARAITSFNVVVALLWRCKAVATSRSNDKDKASTVLYAVDIRRRLSPALPSSYTGNAVLSTYATATCRDLEDGPFSRTVGMVREGAMRMTDGYIRSAIDWGQLYRGFPCGDVFVSSWWKLGFEEVEYPWGKPLYSCPVTNPSKDIILLFPNIDGADKGVNVLISLPKGDMEKFEALFHEFLGAKV